jgi:predicted DNA-binding transcriptional regulator YafY
MTPPRARQSKPQPASAQSTSAASKNKVALSRLLRIHDQLNAARGTCRKVNCSTLARELEVSARTVQRDLDFLRYDLDLPIRYDHETRGFSYDSAEEVPFPIGHNLTPDERIALAVARQSLEVFEGVDFGGQLSSAHSKLTGGLFGQGAHAIEGEFSDYLSVRTPGAGRVDPQVFARVKSALVRHKELQVEYRGLGQPFHVQLRLHPLHLACVASRWVLVARDADEDVIHAYIVARFRHPRICAAGFRRPDGFEASRHLGTSFGAWTGSGPTVVRLRITATGAHHVIERRWHPTQRENLLPQGEVEVTFELGDLHDIARWILGFGADCEVIEPPALRAFVAEQGRRMASANQTSGGVDPSLGGQWPAAFVGFMARPRPSKKR